MSGMNKRGSNKQTPYQAIKSITRSYRRALKAYLVSIETYNTARQNYSNALETRRKADVQALTTCKAAISSAYKTKKYDLIRRAQTDLSSVLQNTYNASNRAVKKYEQAKDVRYNAAKTFEKAHMKMSAALMFFSIQLNVPNSQSLKTPYEIFMNAFAVYQNAIKALFVAVNAFNDAVRDYQEAVSAALDSFNQATIAYNYAVMAACVGALPDVDAIQQAIDDYILAIQEYNDAIRDANVKFQEARDAYNAALDDFAKALHQFETAWIIYMLSAGKKEL